MKWPRTGHLASKITLQTPVVRRRAALPPTVSLAPCPRTRRSRPPPACQRWRRRARPSIKHTRARASVHLSSATASRVGAPPAYLSPPLTLRSISRDTRSADPGDPMWLASLRGASSRVKQSERGARPGVAALQNEGLRLGRTSRPAAWRPPPPHTTPHNMTAQNTTREKTIHAPSFQPRTRASESADLSS
jgi:hypothetical protein